MFGFSTAHVSLGLARLIWGFVDQLGGSGGPSAYFSDVSQPPNVAKVIIHTVNSILGDSIVVSHHRMRSHTDVNLDASEPGLAMLARVGAGH